jgi:hypothetical protein
MQTRIAVTQQHDVFHGQAIMIFISLGKNALDTWMIAKQAR